MLLLMIRKFLKYVEAALKFFYLVLLLMIIIFLLMFYDYSKQLFLIFIKEVLK